MLEDLFYVKYVDKVVITDNTKYIYDKYRQYKLIYNYSSLIDKTIITKLTRDYSDLI